MGTARSDSITSALGGREIPRRWGPGWLLAVIVAMATMLLVGCSGAGPSSPSPTTARNSPRTSPTSTGGAGAHGSWVSGAAFPASGSSPPTALSCGSASFCAAIDSEGDAWTYLGGSWHASPGVGSDSNFTYLQCFANQTCVGGDAQGHLLTYSSGAWSVSSQSYTDYAWYGFSCASANLCIFLDGNGDVYTYTGGNLSAPKQIDPAFGVNANAAGSASAWVSCAPGSQRCLLIDSLGNFATYSEGSWSSLTKVSFQLVSGPDCLSASQCLAVAKGSTPLTGIWELFGGQNWSHVSSAGSADYPSDNQQLGQTLSCTAGFCMGLARVGVVPLRGFAFNGSHWAVTGFFGDSSNEPDLISCASSTFCIALSTPDSGPGTTWIYRPPS